MAKDKKNKKEDSHKEPQKDKRKVGQEKSDLGYIKPRSITTEMEESYLDYAMSVIVARALPDVRDGLKPVHRRILYAMNDLGLKPGGRFRKSATIVGETLGKYHPHGDTAVYDSMVRMAQGFLMRYTLVHGQGNFGSMDGDSAAAMRYTEAKMARISDEMLADIEKDTVNFIPNYDGTKKEPQVLPARIPQLLLNGSMGIAVGMATAIPPHNLKEVIDATVHLIDHQNATIEDLFEYIKGPDFPTGGVIYNEKEIKAAYATGRGGICMRAVAEIQEKKGGKFSIIITEIPYQVNKATLVEKIAELAKSKKVIGISDLRDESSREGVRIVVELKKDAYPKKILNQLYKFTPMQCSFHLNIVALVDGIQPRLLTLKDLIQYFIAHRKEVVTRRTKYDLARAKERAHILEGLKKALDHIDQVIKTIKQSPDRDTAKKNLVKKFKLTEIQAEAILLMRLQTLAALERKKIEDELKEIKKLIAELLAILKSPKKIMDIIKKELFGIKNKYGDERRTRVIKTGVSEFGQEDLIPNEEAIVALTTSNYIKRISPQTYRAQARGGKGIMGMNTREEDVVEHLLLTNTHDNMLFFTNKGRVFQSKVYDIPLGQRTARGQAVVNLIQLAPEEKVTALISIPKFEDTKGYLLMATKKGLVKKTAIDDFKVARKSGLIAIKLDPTDELKWVKITNGKDEILLVTQEGKAIRFTEDESRPMGRATRGVRGIKLSKTDLVQGMDIVQKGANVLVVMENGYGKRTPVGLFARHHRAGSGIKAAAITKKTGNIVDMRIIVEAKEDLVVISEQGQVIRTPMASISRIGRATQGVRIMRLKEGDKVTSIASVKIGEVIEKEEKEAKPGVRPVGDKKEDPSLKNLSKGLPPSPKGYGRAGRSRQGEIKAITSEPVFETKPIKEDESEEAISRKKIVMKIPAKKVAKDTKIRKVAKPSTKRLVMGKKTIKKASKKKQPVKKSTKKAAKKKTIKKPAPKQKTKKK